MADEITLTWLVGIMIGIISAGFSVMFLFINYKYKRKSDMKSEQKDDLNMVRQTAKEMKLEQEGLARDVKMTQMELAKGLKTDQIELAKRVKEEMHEYVKMNIDEVKNRIEAELKIGHGKFELINVSLEGLRKENDRIREYQKESIDRVEKAIYFLLLEEIIMSPKIKNQIWLLI